MKDIGYHLCGRRGDRKGQFINLFVSHKLALGGKIGKLAASWGRKLETGGREERRLIFHSIFSCTFWCLHLLLTGGIQK